MIKNQQVIYDVIQSTCQHMTAEEIYLKCKERESKLSLATVYRNLGSMVEDGVIRRISFVGEPDHYDRNMIRHEHVICEQCGDLMDVELGDLRSYLEEKLGSRLCSYDLSMRYICKTCSQCKH